MIKIRYFEINVAYTLEGEPTIKGEIILVFPDGGDFRVKLNGNEIKLPAELDKPIKLDMKAFVVSWVDAYVRSQMVVDSTPLADTISRAIELP
jgi:hypothetical protein